MNKILENIGNYASKHKKTVLKFGAAIGLGILAFTYNSNNNQDIESTTNTTGQNYSNKELFLETEELKNSFPEPINLNEIKDQLKINDTSRKYEVFIPESLTEKVTQEDIRNLINGKVEFKSSPIEMQIKNQDTTYQTTTDDIIKIKNK